MVADGYTTDDILYLWKSTGPVQIAKNLSLPRFSIENYASSYCNVKTNTGKWRKIENGTSIGILITCSLRHYIQNAFAKCRKAFSQPFSAYLISKFAKLSYLKDETPNTCDRRI